MEEFLFGVLIFSPMIIWWLYTWNKARKVDPYGEIRRMVIKKLMQ